MGEANTIVGQLSVTHLLYTVQDLFCAARQPRFQNSFHTPLFVFWWTRSRLRKRLYGWSQHHSGSVISHPSLVHSSRSVLCSKTVQIPKYFSHTSLCFWWTKSDSIPDQDWGRDCMHEADSFVAQLLVTHLLYTVQDLFSTTRQSSFQNSFHTLLFFFFCGPSHSIPDHDCGRDFMDEANTITGHCSGRIWHCKKIFNEMSCKGRRQKGICLLREGTASYILL